MASAAGRTSSDSSIQSLTAGSDGGRMAFSLGARGRSQRSETRRYTPCMEPDDEDEPEPFRSPDDRERIWLHPSELGSLLPPAPQPAAPVSKPPRRSRRRGGALTVPVLSGMIGAALSLGILALAGGLDRHGSDRVVERVSLPVYDLAAPDGISQLAASVAPAI